MNYRNKARVLVIAMFLVVTGLWRPVPYSQAKPIYQRFSEVALLNCEITLENRTHHMMDMISDNGQSCTADAVRGPFKNSPGTHCNIEVPCPPNSHRLTARIHGQDKDFAQTTMTMRPGEAKVWLVEEKDNRPPPK